MAAQAVRDPFVKLNSRIQIKNPVMFLVSVSAILTTVLFLVSLADIQDAGSGCILGITVILWFTCLFANFVETIAKSREKVQVDSLRVTKQDVGAHRISPAKQKDEVASIVSASLVKEDLMIAKVGEVVPGDGEVIEGTANVDESVITGGSAPIAREADGDRSAVIGGTKVLSGWIMARVISEPGGSFLDRMIAIVEGAARRKTPNGIALEILLVTLSIIPILVIIALYGYSVSSVEQLGTANSTPITSLVALLTCLVPTTTGALLSAISIAGMSRLNEANALAVSGRVIEAAGDMDTLLLDKTGTITLGNRQTCEFTLVDGHEARELADTVQLASLPDGMPGERSVVILAKKIFGIRERELAKERMTFIPFTVRIRMSGMDMVIVIICKGAAEVVKDHVRAQGGIYSRECEAVVKRISKRGGMLSVVAQNHMVLGIIYLKDITKSGVKEEFVDLRKVSIKTAMITGDDPLTAAATAVEAGVDDFLMEVMSGGKLNMTRDLQSKGHTIAMTGNGTNDVPVLAQTDVAVMMNTGTQATKKAGNTMDLGSFPTKLADTARIDKQLLITRGSLTTFSIANNVAKYLAIVPALFMGLYPGLATFNIMHLYDAQSAIFSAITYDALIIMALIPLALRGVKCRETPVGQLLSRSLLAYGMNGIVAPFFSIKLIDMILVTIGLL